MTNVITISLDKDTERILENIPKRMRSNFIRTQILKYENKKLLPYPVEVQEGLKNNKDFEAELILFIERWSNVING